MNRAAVGALYLAVALAGCASSLTTQVSVYRGKTQKLVKEISCDELLSFGIGVETAVGELPGAVDVRLNDASAALDGLISALRETGRVIAQLAGTPAYKKTANEYVKDWAAYASSLQAATPAGKLAQGKLAGRGQYVVQGFDLRTPLNFALRSEIANTSSRDLFVKADGALCAGAADCAAAGSEVKEAAAEPGAVDNLVKAVQQQSNAVSQAAPESDPTGALASAELLRSALGGDELKDEREQLGRAISSAQEAAKEARKLAGNVACESQDPGPSGEDAARVSGAQIKFRARALLDATHGVLLASRALEAKLQERTNNLTKLVETWVREGVLANSPTPGGEAAKRLSKANEALEALVSKQPQAHEHIETLDATGRQLGTAFRATDPNIPIVLADEEGWVEQSVDVLEVHGQGKANYVLTQDGPLTFRLREMRTSALDAVELGLSVADLGLKVVSTLYMPSAGAEGSEDGQAASAECLAPEEVAAIYADLQSQFERAIAAIRDELRKGLEDLAKADPNKPADAALVQRLKGRLIGHNARLSALVATARDSVPQACGNATQSGSVESNPSDKSP